MAYIESHQELARHPKTKKAARKLGISIPTMIGHLHLLWWWCVDYADDGDITKYDAEDIAEAALWEGDAASFLEALMNCGTGGGAGFVDLLPDGTRHIHDWWEYTGMLIERRKKNKERMRVARAKPTDDAVHARVEHIPDTCGATVPNLTVPNLTQPNLSLSAQARAREDERERDFLPDGVKDDEVDAAGDLASDASETSEPPTDIGEKQRRNALRGALTDLWGQPDQAERARWDAGLQQLFDAGYNGQQLRAAIPLYEQRRPQGARTPVGLARNIRAVLAESARASPPAPLSAVPTPSKRHPWQPTEEEINASNRAIEAALDAEIAKLGT